MDLFIAVNFINKDKVNDYFDKTFIEDYKKLKEVVFLDFIHIGREGNKYVDYMNKFERVQENKLWEW